MDRQPRRRGPAAFRWISLAAMLVAVAGTEPAPRAAVEPLTLYQRSGRAPLVVWGVVTDGSHLKAVIGTREVIKCTIPQRPGKTFRLAFRLDSFLRKPWEDKITFKTGEEVVLFLRKFTKEDGEKPESDLYTLMWGAQGKFLLPPEGAQAYVRAVRTFVRIINEPDPDRQAAMLVEALHDKNPYTVAGVFEEVLRQDLGDLDLLPDVIGFFDHPRDDFRTAAMKIMAQILTDAGIAGREIPRLEELADRVRGRAALDASADFRAEAVKVLGILGDDRSRQLLKHLAQEDPAQSVRYAAARALLELNRRH